MAAIKIIFLAFFACAALVNTEAAQLGFRNEKNIIEGFEKIVEPYNQMIKESLGIFEDILKEVMGEVTGNIREELAKALEHISKLVEEAMEHFQHLQAEGKNAKECIEKHLPEVIALVRETSEAQTACVKDSAEKIQEIHDRLIADMKVIREEVANINSAIQKCTDVECLKENGHKLIEQVIVLKGKIRDAVKEAVSVIHETSPQAIECLKASSENFVAEMQKIHDKVFACIRG